MMQKMRLSLPPGTVLRGIKHTYTVKNIICLSERSITVLCNSEDGRSWRLKFYNGNTSVTEEIQRKILSIPMQGVVLPIDIGEFSNIRFSVFPMLSITSTDKFPMSLQLLVDKIIPQLAYVLEQYHKQGVLLRDICPEHILYKPAEQQIAYSGFSNPIMLRGRANVSKSPGWGQHFSYLAPEIEQYGYSTCSDYFALGVTLLTLVKGMNPIETMSRKEFLEKLSRGSVPGIDIPYLKSTPYELYSIEDKIFYLVLGLLIPDPRKRWGYEEIRCWLHNQHIPLVAKGGKTRYQFSEPFVIGNTKCWNEKELAITLASQKEAWNESTMQRLVKFSKTHQMKCCDMFSMYYEDQRISPKGKIFRCIYTLNPTMSGLWWDAVCYPNMQGLIREVNRNQFHINVVSQMLQDQCFSYFCRLRGKIKESVQKNIPEFEQMEQMEIANPGTGVYRCVMRFAQQAQSRTFAIEGTNYTSIYQLLNNFKDNGKRLKSLSRLILANHSFQAWLWANGMEQAGKYANQMAEEHPERSFFLLLSICESQAKEEGTRRLARSLFLHWGEYAPIIWLANNIQHYKVVSKNHEVLFEVFAKAKFCLSDSLEILAQNAQNLLVDYQTFVSRTITDFSVFQQEEDALYEYGYYPVQRDGLFNCKWENGLEVCPAFLRYVEE